MLVLISWWLFYLLLYNNIHFWLEKQFQCFTQWLWITSKTWSDITTSYKTKSSDQSNNPSRSWDMIFWSCRQDVLLPASRLLTQSILSTCSQTTFPLSIFSSYCNSVLHVRCCLSTAWLICQLRQQLCSSELLCSLPLFSASTVSHLL